MPEITRQYNFHINNNYNNFLYQNRKYWLNNNSQQISTAKKADNLQKTIAAGAFISGIGVLLLSKNVQKGSKTLLEGLKNYLEKKLDKSFLDEKGAKMSFYGNIVRHLSSFIDKAESLNNFNSLKDILFMKFMYKTKPTKKIHKTITEFFEYISRKTVKKSYKNTQKHFDKMYNIFDKLDDYILKHGADDIVEFKGENVTKKELISKAKSSREIIKLVVNSFIQEQTQDARYKYIKDTTSQLYSKFWEVSFKDFWSKNNKFKRKEMWQTFIAAEQIKANKTHLAESVAFARNMLSYTDSEMKAYISRYVKNLNSLIPADDAEGADIIKRLDWYLKDSSPLKGNMENFLHEISRLEAHKITENSSIDSVQNYLKDKETNIRLIKILIDESASGEIEDMLEIYRKISPFELAKSGALDTLKKSISSFDRSVNLETGELFDKLRDCEIGSAFTDVLTIAISSAMIAYSIKEAEDEKEINSIMLRSGIPIAGAITTTFISATKLLSNVSAILLGFISGIILNRIGAAAEDFYKSLYNSKN